MADAPDTETLEVKRQLATQDYDCDGCPELIPDETEYLRVAVVIQLHRRDNGRPTAMTIEKFHLDCWGENVD